MIQLNDWNRNFKKTDLLKEDICELDSEIHLGERVEILLEDVGVGIALAQFGVQFIDGGFQVDYLFRLRCQW